jgi:hypothetical protein
VNKNPLSFFKIRWTIITMLFASLSLGSLVAFANHYFQESVTCESNDNRRNVCRIETRGGVRLARQKSDAPCVQGRTWGYNRNAIWVDRGCRAEFEVGRYGGGGDRYGSGEEDRRQKTEDRRQKTNPFYILDFRVVILILITDSSINIKLQI